MRPTFGPNKLQNTRSRLLLVCSGVAHFDVAQWLPGSAFRCAIGVAIPVIAAILLKHTSYGALAGLGALYVGFASYRGVYRSRIRSMVLTSIMTTFMTAVGCLVSKSTSATLFAVPTLAFLFALYATRSQLSNSIATQAVCVLVVLQGLGLGPEDAVGNAGLVLAGGIVQILLLTIIWPVNPRFPERKAISDAYLTLSEFFARIPKGVDELIPGTQRFEDARAILKEARDFRWREEHELLVELMRSAEALRAAAIGFAQTTETLDEAECLTASVLCAQISHSLKLVSQWILTGKFGELSHSADALPEYPETTPDLAHWYQLLRTRIQDLNHVQPHLMDDPLDALPNSGGWMGAISFLMKLPDVGSLRHVALTHAIRYTVTLTAALAIAREFPVSHLYWLPLTVAIVLRADFATTVTRGVSRLLGTLLGVSLATVLFLFFHPSPQVMSVMALVSTWFCFALLQPNYCLYSIGITLYVVFSVGSASVFAHHSPALTRLVATLAGSGLSIAAYVLWPAFQGRELRTVITDALDAQISFGEKVKEALAHHDEHLEEARNHARQLRLRSEGLFQTAALEPWGVTAEELAKARSSILILDANAAELLAFRVDQERNPDEVDRVLRTSKRLRDELAREE